MKLLSRGQGQGLVEYALILVLIAIIVMTGLSGLATQLNAMFVMVAIILFGGATIKPFIATMLVGMVSETYSAIFIAVPLLVVWEKAAARRAARPPRRSRAARRR